MMKKQHTYALSVRWTGNLGPGTSGYRDYARDHVIEAPGKPAISGSSDPAFRGDASRYNPEELLVASLSACHMLWFLHLCSDAGIVVVDYSDAASGTMSENVDGSGEFTEVTLRPKATLADPAREAEAHALHQRARALCFIARSVRFPVRHEPPRDS